MFNFYKFENQHSGLQVTTFQASLPMRNEDTTSPPILKSQVTSQVTCQTHISSSFPLHRLLHSTYLCFFSARHPDAASFLHSCCSDVLSGSKHLSVPRQLHVRKGWGGGGKGLGRGGCEGGGLERRERERETDAGGDARSPRQQRAKFIPRPPITITPLSFLPFPFPPLLSSLSQGKVRPQAETDCVQHLSNQLRRHRRHRRVTNSQQHRAALRRIRQLQQTVHVVLKDICTQQIYMLS